MFSRAIAISAPGMFLSQAPIAINPSTLAAWQTVSIESAITSRDTRLYFMPSVPIEMPSLTVIVPKLCGMAPCTRRESIAESARSFSPMLHGVIVLYPLATATIGFSKSASVNPIARNIDLFGVRSRPAVIVLLRSLSIISSPRQIKTVSRGFSQINADKKTNTGNYYLRKSAFIRGLILVILPCLRGIPSVLSFIDQTTFSEPRHHLAQTAPDAFNRVGASLRLEFLESVFTVAVLFHPFVGKGTGLNLCQQTAHAPPGFIVHDDGTAGHIAILRCVRNRIAHFRDAAFVH